MQIDDAILVNHDDLIDHLGKLKTKSDDIKSRGGEMRKFSGQFNDDYGYNQIAKGMLMRLHNMTEERRLDCLRTLLPGLESLVPAWLGQGTPDMLDAADEEKAPEMSDDAVVPFDPDIAAENEAFAEAADEALAAI